MLFPAEFPPAHVSPPMLEPEPPAEPLESARIADTPALDLTDSRVVRVPGAAGVPVDPVPPSSISSDHAPDMPVVSAGDVPVSALLTPLLPATSGCVPAAPG